MSLKEWLLLSISLLSLVAGVTILVGLLEAIIAFIARTWWVWLALIALLAVVQ